MNKSYRTVWNASTGTWAAAAETTRTRSKGSLNTRRKTLAVVAAGMASFALPQAGAVFAAEADGTTVISEDVETTKPGDGDHDIAMAPEASPAGRAAVANIAATDTVSPAIETGGRILERQIATAGTPVSGADTIQSGGMIGIMTSGDTVLNVNTSGSALPTPVATNPYDVALGQGAVATGPDAGFIPATALGTRANAIGAGTAAVGYRSAASADYAVAMGYQASAVTNSSIAIGNGAAATADGAAGAGSSVAIGTTARASAISSAALGQGASALSDRSSAIGAGTTASGRGSVALGSGATARSGSDGGNIAIGENATAENASGGYGTIAIGAGARAGSGGFSGGMALGVAAASNRANIAIGNNANAVGATGGINGLLALGNNASATANSSIALGNASVADRQNSLSIGRAGAERQITNVAAGTQNTDAVTVSQLSGVVGALGGGAKVNPNGSIEAPTYNVGGKDVRNIGDAVSNLDGRVTGNTGAIADLADQMKNSGLVDPTTGAAIAAVTYDNATKASVTLGGAGATTPVTVKNVANGVDGSDAVNVSQLTDATQSIRDDLASGALDMRYIKVNATGVQANAAGTNAVAIGSGANANGAGALALGTGARAQGVNAVALGFNSVATQANTVSVGRAGNERKIVNVAQGDVSADSTDAINGAQLYDALNSLTTTLDEKTKNLASNGANSMGIMGANAGIMDVTAPLVAVEGLQGNNTASLNGADAATTTAVAIGSSSVAAGGNTVAVGLQNVAGSNNAVAIGSFAQTGADSDYATAIGSNVQATGSEAVAMGANVEAGADNALVIGSNNARAIGAGSVALGNNARVNGGAANSIAVGTNAAVATNVSNALALGAGATVAAGSTGGVALGQGSVANRGNAVSVGGGTVGQRQIINVAAGTGTTDAVNVGQLSSVTSALGGGAAVAANGTVTQPTYKVDGKDYGNVGDALAALDGKSGSGTDPNAVSYDDATKGTVTLGGTGATAPVALKNVADGVDDHDAVNVSQLKTAGLVGDDGSGNLTSLAVAYDDATKSSVTLGGTGATAPVALKNVADGVDDHDAVNVSQLKTTGLVGDDGSGNLTSLAVGYDDATKSKVTLAGGTTGTTITNVAAGTVGATSTDAINGSQLYGTAQSVADALGGGATVGADGKVEAPTYTVGGTDVRTVGDAISNLDGRTTTNTGDISDLKDKLADSGLVDPTTGKAIAAVTYDDATKSSVTLGGTSATAPVALKNVADGVDDHDAVNVSQLKTTGLVGDDGSGNLTSLAVGYDDATKSKVTLAGGTTGTTITNVAAGTVGATSTDAINGSQLYGTAQSVADALGGGATVGADGKVEAPTYTVGGTDVRTVGDAISNLDGRTTTNAGDISDLKDKLADSGLVDPTTGKAIAAVTYDDATKSSVTLGGTSATAPVALKNVADGVDDHDAVNVSQLKTTGLVGDDGSGNLTSLAVAYDDATKSSVTLGGTGATAPVALKNVADGVDDHDAVNVSQLKTTGLVGDDGSGNLTSLAVGYDDATKSKVTLAGGTTGTTITNVAAGTVGATSTDAINGSQLYGTAQSVADALGGGATVGADGKVEAPTYTVGGTDVRTVGDAISNLDGRTTTNAGDISDLKDKLADSGLVDPTTGKAIAAVTYDDATKSSVTLGGTSATAPVALKNVAKGVAGTDAVNVDQLTSGLTDLRQDLTNGAIDLRFIKVNADSATGVAAIANGAQAVAIGSGAGATGAHALALGTGARASGLDSVALGYNSVATQANTVSVGRVGNERRIVNVADGNVAFESKDAINGGQLYAAMNGLSTSVNSTTQQAIDELSSSLDAKTQAAIDQINSRSSQLMDVTAPLVAVEGVQSPNTASLNGGDASTTTAVAIGSGAVASGSNTVANGLNAMAMSDNATAIGSFAQVGAASEYGVAMGSNAQATGKEAVALGANVEAGADNALAIGSGNAQAVGVGSIALGNHAVVNAGAANSIAVGSNASIARNVSDALALGSGANVAAGANGGIALGAGSIANRGNALSIGSAGAERQIINVAAGTAQTDAVNVSQLAGVTKALGGSAGVGADGSITQPTYTIDGKTYSNVSDALVAAAASGGSGTPAEGTVAYDDAAKSAVTLGGVGSTTPVALKNVADGVDDHDAVNVSQLKSTGLVADDGSGNLTSLAVAYDDVNKHAVTLGGTSATSAVALKNVAAGAVNATSNDAINGSQLFGAAQSVAASLGGGATVGADGTITQPTFTVGGTDVHTVGDALTNLDGRVTGNTGDIADLRKQLGNTGLVDAGSGQTLAAVTYDVNPDGSANRGSVTLGGASATAPVALKNVADGVDDHDAVNVSQLKSTGLVADDGSGNLTSLAVGYDDATKDAITLGGATGTTITNVKAGAVSATSTDAINGSQLYGTAQSVADTLGGGVTVNADGTVSKASFLVNGDHYATVEDALTAASKSGATDSLAVKYDNVDHTRVSLGGTGAPAPVVLTNVADGTSRYDAVNYGQLSDLKDQLGSMDGRVGALESGAGGGSGGGSGGAGSDIIGGTGGSGDTSGPIVAPNPGNGNGNVAIGSGSSVADGANNGTAIGSGSNVGGTGGTAIGSGSKATDAGSTAIGQGSSVAAGAGNSVAIGQGSVATESNTVSFGSSGNERRLVNIADGVNASDAATKGQLDRAMGGMQNQVNDLSRNAYSGIAAATALTMIPGVDPNKTLSFGIGGATYRGYQAVAFGGEARITQNLKMKAGVGLSSGGNTVGVGASYQW
ncbi:hypothetical protein I35_4211 [Burkholderia cenocepacia H111]|nr:hypothetical protein I35_4211 [Burkholderia cenocepacia H111]